jgi:hypothetical protein
VEYNQPMLNVDWLAAAVLLKEFGDVLVIFPLAYNLQILPANGRQGPVSDERKTCQTSPVPKSCWPEESHARICRKKFLF